jgi:hypothetical protein
MKKLYLILSLCLILFTEISFSQEEQIIPSDKTIFDVNYYFGFGIIYSDALNINPFLSESNVPTVRRFPFEFLFGLVGDFGKNRIDLDFGFYNQERERDNFEHQITSGTLSLRYLRNVMQFENEDRFYAGLAINYRTSELEFFNKNQTIDLNEPGSFGDVAKLDLYQFHIGPSIGYSIFTSDENEEFVRFQLSYDINIFTNNWDSDYARLSNSVEETGNRFRFQAIFTF